MTDLTDNFSHSHFGSPGQFMWGLNGAGGLRKQTRPFRGDEKMSIRISCGCTLTMCVDSPPVRVWECEHGNVIRAVGA